MAHMSDFLENKLIDWLLRAQAIGITGATAAAGTGPANVYIGLFTANPSDTGGGTEVSTSGTAYARATVVSSLANWAGTQSSGSTTASTGTGGTTSNNGTITIGSTATASWGTITGIGIFDASTSGNLLFWAPLTASKTVNNGDPAPTFSAAALTIQLDN